jgi:hypothetical protein
MGSRGLSSSWLTCDLRHVAGRSRSKLGRLHYPASLRDHGRAPPALSLLLEWDLPCLQVRLFFRGTPTNPLLSWTITYGHGEHLVTVVQCSIILQHTKVAE